MFSIESLLKAKQNNKCALCLKEKELFVDHCHDTGNVRGLLCRECNTSLGKFHDDVNILTRAIDYIIKGKQK